MELSVQGHGMVISKKLETYIRTRAERLSRYLPGTEAVRVEVRKPGSKRDLPKNVQLTVHRKRTLLRVEVGDEDTYIAFDAALDKMLTRIARYKGRRRDRRQVGVPEDLELAAAEAWPTDVLAAIEESAEDEPLTVVRTKNFTIVPMSLEEAIEQMELIGHDFFMFMHDQDSKTKVVYRRKNGDYGLLQPEK
jgi:putative sigma-54 modulation protein